MAQVIFTSQLQRSTGSTTGSLWASDDSGESCSQAAAHLPLIHAVRFS